MRQSEIPNVKSAQVQNASNRILKTYTEYWTEYTIKKIKCSMKKMFIGAVISHA
jgi:hypothetical protein